MQREVWFEKVGWSYMPCHWKGVAVMAVIIFPAIAAIMLGQMALESIGYGRADWLPFAAVFIPALFFLFRIAKRHS